LPAVPPAAHPQLTRRFNVAIPTRDGIVLAADLVLPPQRPAPAVVWRTPYGRSGERETARADLFARAGYAAVWIDVRGRGDSEGTFEPYRNDALDGVDVIAWVGAQAWCDGAVATYGGSYSGRIQWLTALQHPPELRAMIVLVTPADPFVENPTGLPGPMHMHWYRMTDGRGMQYTEAVDWLEVYRHRPLIEMDGAAGFRSALWREECRHQTLDEWWEPLRYQHRIGEVDVPVLHISGWYDDEEIGTPANFAAMTAAGRAGQRLLMGPWGHQVNADRRLGELDLDGVPRRGGPGPCPGRVARRRFALSHGRQRVARPLRVAASGEFRAQPVPPQRRPRELAVRRRTAGRSPGVRRISR
jgi:putative CocE/NonD family hydrolase